MFLKRTNSKKKTKVELIKDLIRVAKEQNNPRITFVDYRKFGKYDCKTIQRQFGGWIEATKQANLDIGRIYTASTEKLLQNLLELWTRLGSLIEITFLAKTVGARQQKTFKTILHVDHIIPWSKGGETVVENLQTLCEQCNLGKSNLMDN